METTEQLALRVARDKFHAGEIPRAVEYFKHCLSELEKQQEPYGYLMRHYEEGPPVFMRHPLPAGYSPLMALETLYAGPAIPQPAAVQDGWGAERAYHEGRGMYECAMLEKGEPWRKFWELTSLDQAYWVAKAAMSASKEASDD